MAAVERRRIEPATGAEGTHIERGMALEDIVAGDPVMVTDDAVNTQFDFAVGKATSGAYVDGIALNDARANRAVEFVRRGEVEGFAGLTPGTFLSVAGGNIDDTEPGEGATPFLRAVTPSRLIKLF